MPTILPLDPARADAATAKTLSAVKAKLGRVPNLFLTLAQAPAALDGYLALSGALGNGRLDAKQRELVALAVAQENDCGYCLAAHTAIGKMVGLDAVAITGARIGQAANPRDAAILALARRIVQQRGRLGAAEIDTARAQGLTDADIVEIVAHVAVNILTNYVNKVAGTEIDFPAVEMARAA